MTTTVSHSDEGEGNGIVVVLPVNNRRAETVERSDLQASMATVQPTVPEPDPGQDHCPAVDPFIMLKTRHAHMQAAYDKLRLVARTKSTVLLTGETGTGKTLLAGWICHLSNRRNAPFVSVHCGAIPDTLIESELFGHEKGAFTGAICRKSGKFEIAEGGTILLDEVGTLSAQAQIKLLQVLQDGTFCSVGGTRSVKSDVRVIASTNNDLKMLAESGLFRKDLYYRLNVFPVEIPPLRRRTRDLPDLVALMLERLNRTIGKRIHSVDTRAMDVLCAHGWPGNIRELENVVERAYIMEQSPLLSPASFPTELFQDGCVPDVNPSEPQLPLPLAQARRSAVDAFERGYLNDLLTLNGGKINRSAAMAGVTPRQIHKLMRKYRLCKEKFY